MMAYVASAVASEPALYGHLVVCMLRARAIPNLDDDEHFGKGASDPYAAAFVAGRSCSSTPVQDDSHPVINRCCDFGVQPTGTKVDILLLDADLLDEDDIIGSSCITAGSSATTHATPQWVPLRSPPAMEGRPSSDASYNAGELLVVSMIVDDYRDDGADASSSGYNVTTLTAESASDMATARAFCPQDTALIACSCSVRNTTTATPECTGAKIVEGPVDGSGTRGCEATADGVPVGLGLAGLVRAHARCISSHSPGMGTWDGQADRRDFMDDCRHDSTACVALMTSEPSGSASGDAAEVRCRAPSSVVSCNWYGEPAGRARGLGTQLEPLSDCVGVGCTGLHAPALDGSGVGCAAYAGATPLGSGVRAQAICSPTGAGALVLPAHSDRSYDVNQTELSQTCPPGFILAGCSCHSTNGHCLGARPEADGRTCTAQLSRGSSFWSAGGRAVATCLFRTPSAELDWFPLSPSPPPAAPQGPLSPSTAECTALEEVRSWMGTKPWLPQKVQDGLSNGRARSSPSTPGAGGSAMASIALYLGGFVTCAVLYLAVVRGGAYFSTKQAKRARTGDAGQPPLTVLGAGAPQLEQTTPTPYSAPMLTEQQRAAAQAGPD